MFIRRLFIVCSVVCLLASSASLAFADEGMWLYNAFPSEKVKAAYGFSPSQAWLDHLRLGSVRFNNGGSGSFVSEDGLAFTNHHVGADCIQSLSTAGHDYMKEGFYAKTLADEAKCPDLELNQLMEIEDVTAKVNAAVKSGLSAAEASQAQRAAMSGIEKDCAKATGLRCDVVTLYSGQLYNLYKYKKYTDIRLVFAPEYQAASFGGDPDNFTYPRYDLDFAFFRVYENDKPAHLDHYLKWSRTGINDGDLVFVSGDPGSTGRLLTMAQLEYLRDVDYPTRLKVYRKLDDALHKFGDESPENARLVTEDIQSYENSFKAINGFWDGLKDKDVMARKTAEQAKLQADFKAKNPSAPDPWEEIAKAVAIEREIYKPLTYVERRRGFNADLALIARTLVRVTAEKVKPNGERLREYRDSALPSVEQQLFSPAPIHKSVDTLTLGVSFRLMQDAMGSNDPVVQKVLNGKSPEDAARAVVEGTKLDDIAVRKQLYEGGWAAVEASTDPMIVLMRDVDPEARAARKQYDDEVDAVEKRDGSIIAKARFAETGFTQPPDAGFTLRLSYGAVKGYTENGKKIPYFTTVGGAFEHSAEKHNQPPFNMVNTWVKAKSSLDLKTPLNFVSTVDIIGGNSGSPTVNKEGEVVGIVFDGNIQSLVWNFQYNDKVARAVHVDARGIQEALRKIYGASALADELMQSKAAAGSAK
jgi:Peptidase S46